MISGRALAVCVMASAALLCAASPIANLHRQLEGTPNVVFAQGQSASTVFATATTTAKFIVMTRSHADVGAVSSFVALMRGNTTHAPHSSFIGEVHTTFNATMHGLVCSLSPSALLGVAGLLGVELVEQDGPVAAVGSLRGPPAPVSARIDQVDSRMSLVSAPRALSAGTQQSPSWNLDRLDQVSQPLNGWYLYNEDGTGVDGECVGGAGEPQPQACGLCVFSGTSAFCAFS